MVERHIVAHNRRLTNHHSHAVIDEEATADGRAGMDLDPRAVAGQLREAACQQTISVPPQPVIQVMRPHCVESRVVEQHGEPAGGRGVTLQYGLNVFSNRSQHVHASLGWSLPSLLSNFICNFRM